MCVIPFILLVMLLYSLGVKNVSTNTGLSFQAILMVSWWDIRVLFRGFVFDFFHDTIKLGYNIFEGTH
jgi:hypothetical protein